MNGRPDVSGLGFLWKVSCGRAATERVRRPQEGRDARVETFVKCMLGDLGGGRLAAKPLGKRCIRERFLY
eukprot:2739819-Pyramimonas_sp.AAC.1